MDALGLRLVENYSWNPCAVCFTIFHSPSSEALKIFLRLKMPFSFYVDEVWQCGRLDATVISS